MHDRDRGAAAAEALADLPSELRDLVRGAAGCSPYLAGLIERDLEWTRLALSGAPEDALEATIEEAMAADGRDLHDALRRAKRQVALLTALADLGGVWPLATVTGALTRLADLAVDRGLAHFGALERQRGRMPRAASTEGDGGNGLVAFAMGKMGAGELNYSSDIDLIVLFDDSRFEMADLPEARTACIRMTRNMAALLSGTRGGYVFRTDLRLRPDAATTPVCLSMDAAERYYESVGRTWERAAWIKGRPAAGDIAAGEAFLERLAPFVWRRHLDFWAIRDAHDMRVRIRRDKGRGGDTGLDDHDMKLGRGGIREIEFYTQTRQIILGGRDPDLRSRGTVEALERLHRKGWADPAAELIADYRAHREIEHRLQMVADLQTHRLPRDDEGWSRIAAMCDRDVADLRSEIGDRLARVARVAEGFFAPAAAPVAAPTPDLGPTAEATLARWPGYPALRSARATEIFQRVRPALLAGLARSANPDEALGHLDAFLRGLPAGVQVFALFESNPQLIDLIVDIAGTSPALARHLSRHPEVLDAVIGGQFFSDWPGVDGLLDGLDRVLARAPDYEECLLAVRRWHNEWHFRIGVHLLRGLLDPLEAGRQYSDIASAVLCGLWPVVVANFAERHGPPPGRGACVLAMGSLGSGVLAATSDLDLIVIYDAGDVESSNGPRPLETRAYYARLTQALITALTANLGPGRLYEVDMRLRPSGRQGPVATSMSAFRAYQTGSAWTWEHLALTRARPVAGDVHLGAEIEAFRRNLLRAPRDPAAILDDLREMRARLARERPSAGAWDLTNGPGRIRDVALMAQAGALLSGSEARSTEGQLAEGRSTLGLATDEVDALTATHALLWRVRAAGRLLTTDAIDPDTVGEGGRSVLARAGGAADIEGLSQEISGAAARAAAIIDRVLTEHPG